MSTAPTLTFGELLKRHRSDVGLTQEALARRARLSVRRISNLERGITRTLHRETIIALADAFGLSGQPRAAFVRAAQSGSDSIVLSRVDGRQGARRLMPLVGRQHELAQIERFLRGELPPLLVLAGEPGIGKSRLLAEVAQRGVDAQLEVLAAGCQGRGGQDPFSPLLMALDHYIARLPPSRRRARLRGCEWLTRLLPELAGTSGIAAPTWTLPPEQERRLIFAAVARFLTSTPDSAGVVLVLDDLQWAPPDALDLMASLLRSDADIPIRVVAAYRDTEVRSGDPLSATLAELARDGLALRMPLGPLGQDAATKLLRLVRADEWSNSSRSATSQLADRDLSRVEACILERAGGVPFFLVSCAQSFSEAAEGREERIPWDIAEMLRQRIAKLPASAREALAVAAVIGRDVPFNLLSVASMPDEELAAGLDAACAERLLLEAGDGRYQFAHDLIREVVAADLGFARRVLLHRRIAEALERGEGERPVERLAYHYAQSGDAEHAAQYLKLAGDRAEALHAFSDAESSYREALMRLDQLGRAVPAAAVREKLGVVLMTGTRFDEAFAVFDAAATAYEDAGDLDGLGKVVTQMGWGEVRRSTPERGLERIHRFLERIGDRELSPQTLAGLLMVQAFLCFVNGRYLEQLAIDDHVVELARSIGDERLSAQARAHRALALNMLGRFEEARTSIEKVLPALELGGDPTSLLTGLNALSGAYQTRGEFDLAAHYLAKQIEVGEKVGDPVALAFILATQAGFLYDAGRWIEMQEAIERAAALLHNLGSSWASPYVLIQRGTLALAQGRGADGTRDLGEAIALAERSGDLQVRYMAQYALASDDLIHARPGQAQARVEALAQAPDAIGGFNPNLLYLLAWIALDLGDRAEAERRIERCLASARERQDRLLLVDALLVHARVAARRDRWSEALAALDEAMRLAQSIKYPYGEARAYYVSARLHAERKEERQAGELYHHALTILRGLGERTYARRIEGAIQVGLL